MNIYKKIFPVISALIGFVVLSSIANAQDQKELFSKNFIKAIASENIDEIVKLKPSPDLWRLILVKETKDMTDSDINLKANKNEKFNQDFENIMYSAKKEKIDLSKLKYKKSKVFEITNDKKKQYSLRIKYDYLGKQGEFALSVFKFDGKYYLSEILISFDVFAVLKKKSKNSEKE